MANVALTTIDNPYDPFNQFNEWFAFDTVIKGYNTCSYLDRISFDTTEMSPEIADVLIENAIDEIIAVNPLGIYKKVYRKAS